MRHAYTSPSQLCGSYCWCVCCHVICFEILSKWLCSFYLNEFKNKGSSSAAEGLPRNTRAIIHFTLNYCQLRGNGQPIVGQNCTGNWKRAREAVVVGSMGRDKNVHKLRIPGIHRAWELPRYSWLLADSARWMAEQLPWCCPPLSQKIYSDAARQKSSQNSHPNPDLDV